MRIDSGLGFVVVLVGLSLVPIGCRQRVTAVQVDRNGPVEVVTPEHGAYTGAFMDFGDAEDDAKSLAEYASKQGAGTVLVSAEDSDIVDGLQSMSDSPVQLEVVPAGN